MHHIDVASATAPYQVQIGVGALQQLAELVGASTRAAVIFPVSLAGQVSAVLDLITAAGASPLSIEVPDGEAAKTAQVLNQCWEKLGAAGFTRDDVVIGYGGGSTTDLAGFVAASWLRGVGLITVPTSVLGMVDAAVGGKTGINTAAGKNLVGAFHEPRGVLCDLGLLETLSPAEVRSGLAEVIKCGFIADPEILQITERDPAAVQQWDSPELAEVIARGIQVKAAVVAHDLTENTSVGAEVGRELLNYGHTFGHAVERHEEYRLRHGEAVSIGMVYVAELAQRVGLMEAALVQHHRAALAAVGLPTAYQGDWPALRALMAKDKKSRGATVRFVALRGIGQPEMLVGPSDEDLVAAYEALAPEH